MEQSYQIGRYSSSRTRIGFRPRSAIAHCPACISPFGVARLTLSRFTPTSVSHRWETPMSISVQEFNIRQFRAEILKISDAELISIFLATRRAQLDGLKAVRLEFRPPLTHSGICSQLRRRQPLGYYLRHSTSWPAYASRYGYPWQC